MNVNDEVVSLYLSYADTHVETKEERRCFTRAFVEELLKIYRGLVTVEELTSFNRTLIELNMCEFRFFSIKLFYQRLPHCRSCKCILDISNSQQNHATCDFCEAVPSVWERWARLPQRC